MEGNWDKQNQLFRSHDFDCDHYEIREIDQFSIASGKEFEWRKRIGIIRHDTRLSYIPRRFTTSSCKVSEEVHRDAAASLLGARRRKRNSPISCDFDIWRCPKMGVPPIVIQKEQINFGVPRFMERPQFFDTIFTRDFDDL